MMGMVPETPQDRGRQWEHDLVGLVGGKVQRGSGNRVYARLDVDGRDVLWSAKHTDHLSWSLSRAVFDDARSAVLGPTSIKPDLTTIIATKLGDGTMIASLDLLELIAWIRKPPALIEPTREDAIKATAKVPPFMR